MTQPIIGISANQRADRENKDCFYLSYTPSGYVKGVQAVGGLPLILPITTDQTAIKRYASMIDKLILTGGQNVDPSFYGEKRTVASDDYFLERDEFEFALARETMKQGKPIFSVCRGTQLMNIALGGTLYQDIEAHWQDDAGDYLTQDMVIKAGSVLADFYGTKNRINSFHHQSIKDLAPDLDIIAHDPSDQVIEAVQSTKPGLAYLGVQWHPELLFAKRKEDFKLFDYVVNRL